MRYSCVLLVLISFVSCSDSVSLEDRLTVDLVQEATLQKGPLQTVQVKPKSNYALTQLTLKREELNQETGTLLLEFNEELPQGYELHYTINNGELQKSSNPEIKVELLEGNNVLLAFLSLANGLRIPDSNAVYLNNYAFGEVSPTQLTKTGAHLFHHISKKADSSDMYVDFYLENNTPNSNYFARLISDGNVFNLPINEAFKLNGLTKEYHNLRIQLVDAKGSVVAGPFNDTGVISVEIQ